MVGYDLLNTDNDTDEVNNIGESASTEAVHGKRKKAKHMQLCAQIVVNHLCHDGLGGYIDIWWPQPADGWEFDPQDVSYSAVYCH
jgi:hypothetical protein